MIKPDSILEISCGGHSKLYETKGREWDLFVGIDIKMELCIQAKEQGLEVVCCDAFNLPFKPRSFQDAYIQCYTAILEYKQVSHHIICLPSCSLEMNRYLVNAVKNLPGVSIDVDYSRNWGKKDACVMYL